MIFKVVSVLILAWIGISTSKLLPGGHFPLDFKITPLFVNGMPTHAFSSKSSLVPPPLDCAFLDPTRFTNFNKIDTGQSRSDIFKHTTRTVASQFHNISCNELPIPISAFSPFTVRLTGGIDAIFAHAAPIESVSSSPEYSFCDTTRKWLDSQRETLESMNEKSTMVDDLYHHHQPENSFRKQHVESPKAIDHSNTQPKQQTLSQLNNLCSQLFCRPTDKTIQEIFQNFSKASMDGAFFPTSITTDFSVKLIWDEANNNITKRYFMNLNKLVSLYNYCQYCEQENPSFEYYHQEKLSGICTLNFSYAELFGVKKDDSMNKRDHDFIANTTNNLEHGKLGFASSSTSYDACGENGFSLPLLNVMIYASLVSESTLQYYFPVRMCYCYNSASFSSKCDDWSLTYYTEPFQNGIRSIFITLYIIELIVIVLMVLLPLEFKHVMGWHSSQKLKLAKELARRKQCFHNQETETDYDHQAALHNNTDSLTDDSNCSIDEHSADAHGSDNTSGHPPAMETSFRLDSSNIRKYVVKKSYGNRIRTRSRGLSSLSDSLLLNSHLHSDPSQSHTANTSSSSPPQPNPQHTDPIPSSPNEETGLQSHSRALYYSTHDKHETDDNLSHVSLVSEKVYSKKTKISRLKQALISIIKSISDFRIIATLISICNLLLGFISLISILPYDARLVLISIDCILSLMGLIPIVFQWLVVLRTMENKDSITHNTSTNTSNNIKILSLFVFMCTLFLFIGYILTVIFVTGYSRVLLARYIMMVVLFLYFITIFPLLVIYGIKVYFRVLRENKEIRFFQFKFTKYLIFESLTYLYFTFYTIYFIVSYPYFLFTFNNIGDRFMTVYPWVITHFFILLSYCNRFYFLSDWFCIKQFYNTLFANAFCGICHRRKKEIHDTSAFYHHGHHETIHAVRKISDASNTSSHQHVFDNHYSISSFDHNNEESTESNYSHQHKTAHPKHITDQVQEPHAAEQD